MAANGPPAAPANGRIFWIDVAQRFGLPALLAGFLVWFLVTRISQVLIALQDTQQEMALLLKQCCPK